MKPLGKHALEHYFKKWGNAQYSRKYTQHDNLARNAWQLMWATIIIDNVKCPNEHSFLPQLHTRAQGLVSSTPTSCIQGAQLHWVELTQTEGSTWPEHYTRVLKAHSAAVRSSPPPRSHQQWGPGPVALSCLLGGCFGCIGKDPARLLCQDLYRDP